MSTNCNRCSRSLDDDPFEHQEALIIQFRAGYGSVFGDGNHVGGVLCQHCVKEVLGPWLSVSDTQPAELPLPRGAFQENQPRLVRLKKHVKGS